MSDTIPTRSYAFELFGPRRVRPLGELPALLQERLKNGVLGKVPFTVPPLTLLQLIAEKNSLSKEVARAQRRLAQIELELLTAE